MTVAIAALSVTVLAVHGAIRATFDMKSEFFNTNLRFTMLYDIAAVIKAYPNTPLEVFKEHEVDTDLVRKIVIERYTPYRHDPLNIPKDGEHDDTISGLVVKMPLVAVAEQWFAVISYAPGEFIRSKFERFGILMGLGEVYPCGPRDFLGLSHVPRETWQALGEPSLPAAYAASVLQLRYFPAGTLLFRPISYFIVSLVLLVLLAYKRPNGAILISSLIAAAWIYWLTFLPLPIACDIRYSYFPCVAIMFCAAICYFAIVHPWLRSRRAQLTTLSRSVAPAVQSAGLMRRTPYQALARKTLQ
jgi:hypothetical protein